MVDLAIYFIFYTDIINNHRYYNIIDLDMLLFSCFKKDSEFSSLLCEGQVYIQSQNSYFFIVKSDYCSSIVCLALKT